MPTITPDSSITIAFSVTDRSASAAWYKQHFGFDEIFSADEAGWTELATNTPGVTIGLGDAEEIKPGSTMPVFGVADFDQARAALEAEGVGFDGDTIVVDGMVKVAAFFDPDGNPLMIAEDLSKA
jgi:catechol 2,3-dioxygenase-like lactoylglutathione lyase family enzyme